MKKCIIIAMLLGCAAFIDTPDDYGSYALPAVAYTAPEAFAVDEGEACTYDGGVLWDGDDVYRCRM